MVSRDEAGLRQGLTDELASRVTDPEGAGFSDAEQALLRGLRLMKAETAELAIETLREHFDVDRDRGEIGQILHAFGVYRGVHTTLALLGVRILDEAGHPLDPADGFGVVTLSDGRFKARHEVDFR